MLAAGLFARWCGFGTETSGRFWFRHYHDALLLPSLQAFRSPWSLVQIPSWCEEKASVGSTCVESENRLSVLRWTPTMRGKLLVSNVLYGCECDSRPIPSCEELKTIMTKKDTMSLYSSSSQTVLSSLSNKNNNFTK